MLTLHGAVVRIKWEKERDGGLPSAWHRDGIRQIFVVSKGGCYWWSVLSSPINSPLDPAGKICWCRTHFVHSVTQRITSREDRAIRTGAIYSQHVLLFCCFSPGCSQAEMASHVYWKHWEVSQRQWCCGCWFQSISRHTGHLAERQLVISSPSRAMMGRILTGNQDTGS